MKKWIKKKLLIWKLQKELKECEKKMLAISQNFGRFGFTKDAFDIGNPIIKRMREIEKELKLIKK